jgi:hypothetical protein
MSWRVRATLLFVLALIIIAASLAMLLYTFWPVENLTEQIPLAPTLLAPP